MNKREELYIQPFLQAPNLFDKYGFGSNDTIQTHITRDIVIYPHFGVPFLDMLPATIRYQNQDYAVMNALFMSGCLISIASRDGGYIFLDLPLSQFIKTNQIHKNWELEAKCDFNLSFLRFTYNLMPVPFAIPFSFRLKIEK